MKIITIVVVAVVVIIVVDSHQAEIYCPRGWIIQGQVNYTYRANEDNRYYKHAMCLICRINSLAVPPFGAVEVCIFKESGFNNNTRYRRSSKICGYNIEDSQEIKQNFFDICSSTYTSPKCGISINLTEEFKKTIETMTFLNCTQTNLMPIQPQIVDIQCPKNWKFGSTKQQFKTYHLNRCPALNTKTQELCVVCNSPTSPNTKIFFCTATLDLFLLNSTLDVMIHNETETKNKEKPNNPSNSNSSICRLSFSYNKYQFKEQIPLEELIKKYRKEDPKVNCSFSNVSFNCLL
jgi:hypothetical protein